MSVDAHSDPGRPAQAESGRGPEHVLAPLNQPLVCPVLVGREAQVATLARDLDEARRGAGRTILVAGEAGIGKSRLVAAAKVRAAAVGCQVLQGTCFEPDRTLPYAPLLDLMRAFLGAHDPAKVAELLGPAAGELVKLVPELAARLPGLVPTPPLDPEQEKRRLVLALVQVLEGLAAERSLLAVVEDLHWCDETSLEVLHALARRIGTQPILLVLTYRSDEVHPVLRHFLAGLDRERLAVEMPLGRLTADGVEAMVRAIFDLRRPVRLDFLEAIYGLTEGNPFFVEEVLKSLVAAGEIFYADGGWDRKPLDQLDIPRSVQDAVQRRAAALGPSAREVLTLAAVA
ncbi:MAG: ATP-binding protein, partial [Actinomycetes bacterium]